jgi:hypothetical protein
MVHSQRKPTIVEDCLALLRVFLLKHLKYVDLIGLDVLLGGKTVAAHSFWARGDPSIHGEDNSPRAAWDQGMTNRLQGICSVKVVVAESIGSILRLVIVESFVCLDCRLSR